MNIDGVIGQLYEIIAGARDNKSPAGYFPALYRNVTIRVRDGIHNGEFENGPRLEQLDVVFASRYLDAYSGWKAGKQISKSWRIAFEQTSNPSLLITQHLLAGINAHINLDLGIAAATVAPGAEITGLANDFNAINHILSSMVEGVEDEIGEVSPWLRLLDFAGGRKDETIINFSIEKARKWAWAFAERLAALDRQSQDQLIAQVDSETEHLGYLIVNPPGLLLSTALFVIRQRENGSVAHIIDVLRHQT